MRGTGTADIVIAPYADCQLDRSARRRTIERNHAARRRHDRRSRCHRRPRCRRVKLRFDRPSRRAFTAVDAPQEHRARFTPHSVVVAAGQKTVDQIPHCKGLVMSPVGSLSLSQGKYRLVVTSDSSARRRETLGFCRKEVEEMGKTRVQRVPRLNTY
jgi:hypothetical protein